MKILFLVTLPKRENSSVFEHKYERHHYKWKYARGNKANIGRIRRTQYDANRREIVEITNLRRCK